MAFRSTRDLVNKLEKMGQLLRIKEEVSPDLVMAEIQRQAYRRGLGAVFFEKVRNSPFPAVSNLYGTRERIDQIFENEVPGLEALVLIRSNPFNLLNLKRYLRALGCALNALPFPSFGKTPVMFSECQVSDLPQIKSWPRDGGAFITLPQVYSEDPVSPGIMGSNVGMYRIQISGGNYIKDHEVGLHYQIHRGLGVHHTRALQTGKPLKVSIWIGGPPAHAFAAVMPLPEGMSELSFAGMLNGRNFRYKKWRGFTLSSDSDFCIVGEIQLNDLKPEGPFGDHLGYYSLTHPFPYLKVMKVFHRQDAIWPFTVVGRPPQEDSSFGYLIHKLTKSLVTREIPGVKALHAVDEAGVHPLLLAIGMERYVPYEERRPMELHTIAHRILGFGQCSLAKYLFIVAEEDNPNLDIKDIPSFFKHLLERIDLEKDLHFITQTTIDTLDYSGHGINRGSKLFIAACGRKRRELATDFVHLTSPFPSKLFLPGILIVEGPPFQVEDTSDFLARLSKTVNSALKGIPLLIIVDDLAFATESMANFLWLTFTRSNPAADIHALDPIHQDKHFGAKTAIFIDARKKPHHADALDVPTEITELATEILERAIRNQ